MDDMIYVAMNGAKALAQRQEALTHNLANANTTGFRAELTAFRAVPANAEGAASTRVFNIEASAGFDPTPGPVVSTGRPLDLAIRGPGWFVVQTVTGEEAYTRNGAFEVGADGSLQTAGGAVVMGDGGPLAVPQNATVNIGGDGTVSARVGNQPPVQIGRLRLVNPEPFELKRGPDGMMRTVGGAPAADDPAVRVVEGALEGSNVNVVESMVGMIEVSRRFEMQMRLLQNAENNSQRAAQLLSLSS